jgi:polyhydroxyalkanoic acid inclusion protein PhaP
METKPYELVDAFWKNWSQSLSLFSSAGKQLEQLTLETLKQQQDALHKLTSGVDELEKELQQFTAQFNSQYTDYVKQLTGNSLNDQINEWQEKWKELSAHMHQLTVSPTKTSLSILTQTSGQFEETTKQFIEQQQLQREEAQKQLEGFLEEFKSKQLELAKKFEENSKNLFTSIK